MSNHYSIFPRPTQQLLQFQIEHYTERLASARQRANSDDKVREVAFLRKQLWQFKQLFRSINN